MKSRQPLLHRILRALVDEWGHDEVTAALTTIAEDSTGEQPVAPKTPSARKKPTATAQVERAPLEGEQKDALIDLAARYDRKEFLPSVAHVREFLVMMGDSPKKIKDRAEAFRVLLRRLTGLPADRVRELATSALHSGPSQLGPLSDAIAAVGEQIPRRRQANTNDEETGEQH